MAFVCVYTLAYATHAATPLSYLHTNGPAADPVTHLNWGLLTVSILVTTLIGALVLWAALHKRMPHIDKRGDRQIEPEGGGMAWIYIGAGISSLVLLGCATWTILTLSAVAAPTGRSMTDIEIIGHQWWWEVRYLGADRSPDFVTANEIHIPVGLPIRFKLDSADVIHSFWIPKLAGKTDVIPGQTNFAWVQADSAGDFSGMCGEYCGAQHAHMALHVIADELTDFDAWRRNQMTVSAAPQSATLQHGLEVFTTNCGTCHTVRGTQTNGKVGPDLTHLMSRNTIVSGLVNNNTGYLTGWIADPQALKPGTRMPAISLTPTDLHAVVSYLETLQ
jgi:cytochrome c oxidase subunit 2